MTNLETLLNRFQVILNRIKMTNEQKEDLVKEAFDRVCEDTKIFRRIYGFSFDKDIADYNLCYLAEINDYYEITSLASEPPSEQAVMEFLTSGDPPEVNITVDEEKINKSIVVDIYNVFYNEGDKNVSLPFFPITKCIWRYTGEDEDNLDNKQLAFECAVIPDIETLSNAEIDIISKAMYEYIRYRVSSSVANNIELQNNNIEYQRYFNEVRSLTDKYPQAYNLCVSRTWL